MKNARSIIKRPIVTEKSTDNMMDGFYTFEVAKKATKPEIRKAVEELFNVKVLKVNTANVKGKKKRVNLNVGYTSDWKKAMVQIDTDPQDTVYLGEGGKEVTVKNTYNSSIDEFAM